jgi:hypothetical protein
MADSAGQRIGRGLRRTRRGCVLLLGLLVVVLALGVGRLLLADRGSFGPTEQRTAHHTLHYWGHLLAARGLSVMPGMRRHAATQYRKAAYHVRTPAERALLTTDRPHTIPEGLVDVGRLGWHGLGALVGS